MEAATTAATTTLAPEPVYTVSATLPNEPFSDELSNRSSSKFLDLEQRVVGAVSEIPHEIHFNMYIYFNGILTYYVDFAVLLPCNKIYKEKFRNQFDHCFVKEFR